MMKIFVIILVCTILCGANAQVKPAKLFIGVIFENHFAGNSHEKLVNISVEFINKDLDILPQTTLHYVRKISNCKPKDSLEGSLNLINEHDVKGILGCPCSLDSSYAAILSGSLSVPMIASSADSSLLSDKVTYPFFMRTVPTNLDEFRSLIDMIPFFGWNTMCTIHTDYFEYPEIFYSMAAERGIYIRQDITVGSSNLDSMLKGIRNSGCRIISSIAFRDETKELMLEAEKQNLLEPGYVWILGTDSFLAIQKEFKYDTEFMRKMEGSLTISLSQPLDPKLLKKYKESFNDMPVPADSEISYDFPNYNMYAQYVPDAIYTLALSLHHIYYKDMDNLKKPDYDNKTITHKYENGQLLLDTMKNLTFQGLSGNITYDKNGDRIVQPRLLNARFEDNKLQLVEISVFDVNSDAGHDLFVLNLESVSNDILWGSGESTNLTDFVAGGIAALNSVPQDYVCVVNCPSEQSYTVIIIVACVSLAILLVACVTFIYRRHIAAMRIKRQCIFTVSELSEWDPPELERESCKMNSEGLSVGESGTAMLQGRLVSLNPLKMGFMDEVGGTALLPLLSIRHDKLLGFVGVVCEPNYLILEHACKGTIYAALVDDKIPEEMDLQLSLCRDAATGLEYLHKINITHDLLTLTHLTFTKDFSCKITGFLLKEWDISRTNVDSLLFLLLNCLYSEVIKGVHDRKLADLYSYGLCAFCILSLNPWPWGEDIHTGENYIFQREALRIAIINNKEVPPLTEVVDSWDTDSKEMKLLEMIKNSLDRQPSYRPLCHEYNKFLNSMLPNHSTIIEGMQAKYLNQLEVVVSERTKQLRDEKAETEGILTNIENLICSLLPEHVVNLLSSGVSSTVAESYADVAVGRVQIIDYHKFDDTLDCVQIITLVNFIFKQLDIICTDVGVDHVRHDIGIYVVCAGAFNYCGRPVESVVNFALNAISRVEVPHPKTGERVLLGCSVAFGHVSSGVIGSNRMAFDIFGAADDESTNLLQGVEGDKVILSLSAAETLKDDSKFNLCPIDLKNGIKAMHIPSLTEDEHEIIRTIGSKSNSTVATTNASYRGYREKKNKLHALLNMAGLTPEVVTVSGNHSKRRGGRSRRRSFVSIRSGNCSGTSSLTSLPYLSVPVNDRSAQSSFGNISIDLPTLRLVEEPVCEAGPKR